MAWFGKATFTTGKGSYLALDTSKWDAPWRSYSISGESREALDTTHTRSPDGVMEFVPGGFTNPGTLEVTFNFDPGNLPPINAPAEPMRLVLVKPDSTDQRIYSGTGFLTNWSADVPEGGQLATATATIQKSGVWVTLPAEPAEAL